MGDYNIISNGTSRYSPEGARAAVAPRSGQGSALRGGDRAARTKRGGGKLDLVDPHFASLQGEPREPPHGVSGAQIYPVAKERPGTESWP
jgi:hypothetical protein